MEQRVIQMVGRVSGQLTVIARAPQRAINGEVMWECLCDCGGTVAASGAHLRQERVTSCGCAQRASWVIDGVSRLVEQRTWYGILARCFNVRNANYARYGGRGISVHPDWIGLEGWPRFFAHVGPRPSSAHSIDRFPDNNGNYEPGNVRWATGSEQQANKRTTHLIEYNGEKLPLKVMAKKYGISRCTLLNRLRTMSVTDALTKPIDKVKRAAGAAGIESRRTNTDSVTAGGFRR